MAVHALVHNVVLLGTVFLPQVSFKSVMADFKDWHSVWSERDLIKMFLISLFPYA